LRDPVKVKDEVLNDVLATSSRQLEESAKNIEEIRSLLQWAKSPRERTAVNIILDDQRKVIKSLDRLVNDLSEIYNKPV
jgi:hypothetical protein